MGEECNIQSLQHISNWIYVAPRKSVVITQKYGRLEFLLSLDILNLFKTCKVNVLQFIHI